MDLAIVLDSQAAIPLYRKLYEELRRAILDGRLSPGQKVPSTRSLAKSLGISRITVTQSYEQLIDEGYLQAIAGSGTFVNTQLPDKLLHSDSHSSIPKSSRFSIELSQYGAELAQMNVAIATEPDLPISFRYGQPAFERFPLQLWRKLLSRHCRSSLDWLDYASDPLGHKPLREAIAAYLSRSRAVRCTSEQILMVNGTQQALDLIARLLIDSNDIVALEEPSYLNRV